tara:strand:+ start:271 stop:543 length:273 start_codon:yes stop_codon:yes gene_type:complete
MTTDEFGKALARIQRDSFIEKQIQLHADYLPKRFEEVLKESEELNREDRNRYEAACFKSMLESAIKQITAINKNLEERRDEANQSHTKRN